MTDARQAMTPGVLIVSDRSIWRPRFSCDAGWILRIFRAGCVLFVLFASDMRMASLDFVWNLYDRGAAVLQTGTAGRPARPVVRVHGATPPQDAADPQTDAGQSPVHEAPVAPPSVRATK